MPMRRSIVWVDPAGNERMTQLTSSAGATLTQGLLLNLSNANLENWHEGPILTPAFGSPAVTDYNSVGEMLAVSAIDALGTSYRFFIPAPQKGLFTTDDNTVDVTNPLFFTLNAQAAFTLIVPQTSLDVINLLAGWLFRRAQTVREAYLCDGLHATLRMCVVWQDSFGKTTLISYNGVVPMGNFLAAADGLSNAIPVQTWEGPLNNIPPFAPTIGIYQSVLDAARLVFADVNGNRMQVIVPAPILAMFMADGKTVNPAYPLLGAVIVAAVSELIVPSSGLPITSFIGGSLVRSNQQGTV